VRSRARQLSIILPVEARDLTSEQVASLRERLTGKTVRKAPPPAPRSWQAIVLGVDTARNSGWAISAAGKHVQSGELDTHDAEAIRKVVATAVLRAWAEVLPCVLVEEKPWGGTVATVAGLGAAREAWEGAWRDLAEGHRGKIVRVHPSTWRAAILGKGYVGKPRGVCRDAERSMALGIIGHPGGKHPLAIGHDEAPAVCIARWGSQAGEVGLVLSNRAREASLRFWREKR
jgi:hypothetical protein